MTAPQNGPLEGQQGAQGGSTAGDGSEAASGEQGAGSNGSEGTEGQGAATLTYSDVLAALSDEQRAAITAEVSKKNGEARTQRQRAKAAEDKLAAAGQQQAEPDQSGGQNGAQNGSQGGQQSREDGRTREQLATARARVAAAEVRSIAATTGFADPEDAAALLGDLSSYVDADFTVDAEAIRSDVDDLLARKPHLGKAGGNGGRQRPGRPAPDGSQGSSASGGGSKRSGVDAGRELYRSKHARPAAGNVQTTSS